MPRNPLHSKNVVYGRWVVSEDRPVFSVGSTLIEMSMSERWWNHRSISDRLEVLGLDPTLAVAMMLAETDSCRSARRRWLRPSSKHPRIGNAVP